MPKRFSITNAERVEQVNEAGRMVQHVVAYGGDTMDVSDGYHTMDELYDHRITLYITLCRSIQGRQNSGIPRVWRSKLHGDGKGLPGWFLLGIGFDKGKQITYHVPLARWDETQFAETRERAPDFDGHTSADVLERLKTLV